MAELNDIYDRERKLTGRVHRRGTPWNKGEYGLVVCVWVYDGKGKVLLTRRAPEKSAPGTWENSGGAAKAGEDSLSAIVRELREETGIVAAPEEFELLDACTERGTHYDHYCLHRDSSKVKVYQSALSFKANCPLYALPTEIGFAASRLLLFPPAGSLKLSAAEVKAAFRL